MLDRVVVEPARGFFSRSMRRAGADFLILVIASKVGPAQMGSIGVLFSLIRKTENHPIYVRGNHLSDRQTGGALDIVGPGSKAQSEAQTVPVAEKGPIKIWQSYWAALLDGSTMHERMHVTSVGFLLPSS